MTSKRKLWPAWLSKVADTASLADLLVRIAIGLGIGAAMRRWLDVPLVFSILGGAGTLFVLMAFGYLWHLNKRSSEGFRESKGTESKRPGVKDCEAFPEGLEPIYIAALQEILDKDGVSEIDLSAILNEQGFDVPPNCLTAIIDRTGLVNRTFDGRGKIKPEFRSSLERKLPKFRMGGLSGAKTERARGLLERENQELKAASVKVFPPSISMEAPKQLHFGHTSESWAFLTGRINASETVWIATHEATNFRGQQCLSKPVERLILLHPYGRAIRETAHVSLERDLATNARRDYQFDESGEKQRCICTVV